MCVCVCVCVCVWWEFSGWGGVAVWAQRQQWQRRKHVRWTLWKTVACVEDIPLTTVRTHPTDLPWDEDGMKQDITPLLSPSLSMYLSIYLPIYLSLCCFRVNSGCVIATTWCTFYSYSGKHDITRTETNVTQCKFASLLRLSKQLCLSTKGFHTELEDLQ